MREREDRYEGRENGRGKEGGRVSMERESEMLGRKETRQGERSKKIYDIGEEQGLGVNGGGRGTRAESGEENRN